MSFNLRTFLGGHKVLVGFVLLAVLVVGWWNYAFPSGSWRYKMTVTVETPEGIKTGSAVRQIGQSRDFRIGDAPAGHSGATGEAVVVDLGTRGKLFLLMGEDHYYFFQLFPFSKGGNTREGIEYYSHLKNVKASVLGVKNMIPQLVTFKNVNDPTTVKSVDINNLSSTFGDGVTLKDITIETTDEPMTWNILKVLPWLENHVGNFYGEKYATSGTLAGRLDKSSFIWGE